MDNEAQVGSAKAPSSLTGLLKPLRLKLISHRSTTGQFYLATEGGQKLPGQRSVSIDSGINEATIITVQFVVNNRDIWIEE